MLSRGNSAKHSWSQWKSPGGGYCQRGEEGEPRDGVWFPHHEEIVWLRFWNHKMLSEAKGRSGNAELETKADELDSGFRTDRTVWWRLKGLVLKMYLALPTPPSDLGRCLRGHKVPLERSTGSG